MRWRWYRYQLVTVGRVSGNRNSVPFMRFRRAKDALEWCIRMNDHQNRTQPSGTSLVYWEFEEIP